MIAGAPTMSRLQISMRDWLADQEAFVTAVHACVDPLGLPVDTAAASACVNQFVIAHTSEFEQHQQRVNAAIRDARRDGLTD